MMVLSSPHASNIYTTIAMIRYGKEKDDVSGGIMYRIFKGIPTGLTVRVLATTRISICLIDIGKDIVQYIRNK